jgi:2-succinyl-5-enolpyruvyl-6-hydroxy-3-cyclohexene-1-carboxylate synthase
VKDATNASHALALTLVDELARGGVTEACLAPGSRSAPLALALEADDRIRVHVRIDERSASFLALGLAKASGVPAVVLSTSGTAAANFHPAVIEAHESRTPMIVITADRPPELRATGANQTIDQIKLYGDAVRWFCEIGTPEASEGSARYWRSVASRAVAESTGPRAGPVHLNAAFREPLVPGTQRWPHPLDGRSGGAPWHKVERAPRDPGDELVSDLARRIERAERGVIVAGEGAGAPLSWLRLAELVGYPVIAEPTSGLRSGEAAISTYDALLRNERFAGAHRPELVLRVGKPGTSKVLGTWLGDAEHIFVDEGAEPLDPDRSARIVVDADPERTAIALSKAASGRSRSAWYELWRRAEGIARAAMDRSIDSRSELNEPGVARDVARLMPEGSTLVVASSMPVRDLDWFMEPHAGLNVVGNRGASGIDGFVSTVLGVALGIGGPVVGLAGDLSMIHDSNGLSVTGGPGPDAVFVVINNDGGGIFSFLPQAALTESFEVLFGTSHGMDFGALAALHRCGYELAVSAAELRGAVENARRAGGINLVEVRTDRTRNVRQHQEIWDAVHVALEELTA